jgi:anti-sigma regulatory factor (Ser/Thr protein kinase)
MAEITLRADLSELTVLAEFVDRFAAAESLPSEIAFQLDLVLEELVTNCVAHGAAGATGGAIRVALERRGDLIEVAMVDDGAAFDPRTAPAPDLDAPLEERRIGGLGVYLVRQFVDEIDYRREDGRNHLRLRKRITPRRESDEGAQRG